MARGRRAERGMVTAELAVAIPALLVVLALCLSGLGLAVDQVRCVDAARVAARAASRGDSDSQVREVATRVAPEGAQVRVRRNGTGVVVEVRAQPRRLLVGAPAGRGEAVTVLEPAVRGGQP